MSKIEITNLFKSQSVNEGYLKNISEKILRILAQDQKTEISLVVVSRNKMRSLNKKYRGENRVTDVLSFPNFVQEPAGRLVTKLRTRRSEAEAGYPKFILPQKFQKYLGEIVICYPQAKKQAKELGHSLKKELTIILIHGILHLVGYHHG